MAETAGRREATRALVRMLDDLGITRPREPGTLSWSGLVRWIWHSLIARPWPTVAVCLGYLEASGRYVELWCRACFPPGRARLATPRRPSQLRLVLGPGVYSWPSVRLMYSQPEPLGWSASATAQSTPHCPKVMSMSLSCTDVSPTGERHLKTDIIYEYLGNCR